MSSSHTSTFIVDGVEICVDIHKLRPHALILPSKRVKLELFRSFIDDTEENNRWGNERGGKFGPALLLQRFADDNLDDELKGHVIRICEADLSFPIWMFQGQIIDGLHRLTKAFVQEEKDILVQEWETIPDEAVLKEP